MVYKQFIRPALFQQDPEAAHERLFQMAEMVECLPGGLAMLSSTYSPPTEKALEQTLFGYPFRNPLGLAAGFDKNIRLPYLAKALGFGYMEVGSISARSWQGNPKPRLFRLPEDEAIINRMGLNNKGVAFLASRIKHLPMDWPVGISLVKTPDPNIMEHDALADFAEVIRAVYGKGAYLSLNISCPNTREGKTFEDPQALESLLHHLRQVEADCRENQPTVAARPWCLKVSPDLDATQLSELFEVACRYQIAGWVACNTTANRTGLKTPSSTISQIGAGGLSGAPLQALSTQVLGLLYQLGQKHPGMVYMGVGGIHTVDSAWEKITHGASLLQLYTGLVYEGPALLRQLNEGLMHKLEAHGYNHIQEAVGSALR